MEELERKRRVLNMMISIHTFLRDGYKLKALLTDMALVVSSVFLNSLVFVDHSRLNRLLNTSLDFYLIIGITTLSIFCLSLIAILVNWKQKAENHKNAASSLSNVLNDLRSLLASKEAKLEAVESFNQNYDRINGIIEPIPSKKFNRLKAKHLRKVEFSKYLDSNKHAPYWLNILKFFLKSFKNES